MAAHDCSRFSERGHQVDLPNVPDNPQGWNSLESDPQYPEWENWTGSVLLSDEIARYSQDPKYKLIEPFDEKYLKPARYQLRLGDEARIGGKRQSIGPQQPLRLEPHQVAIVKTLEHLNIPRFLIARWNLTVDRVYEGLLWVGALQVDPGWVGYLPCPLYNMSDEEVVLQYGDKLFTIDFVRTTPFRRPTCKSYEQDFRTNPPLSFFDRKHLRSGPYQALRQLGELRTFRAFAGGLFGVFFAALAALTTALGVLATRPSGAPPGISSWWPTLALMSSSVAFVLSIFAVVVVLRRTRKF
jgi:deoxycytidine triphosphate deaminase